MAFKNVFLALGLAHDEATVEAWRSDLARIVRRQFERSGKSQVSFAQQLGIKQSVLSPIVNGNLGRVSVEFLLKLCVRLGTAGEARWSGSAETAGANEAPEKGAAGRRKMVNTTHRGVRPATRGEP